MNSLPRKEVKFLVLDITLKGGIERFVANMAMLLLQHGYPVTIYSFHRTNSEPLYALPINVKIVYLTEIAFRTHFYKWSTLWSCIRFVSMQRRFCTPFVAISTNPITTIFLWLFGNKLLNQTIASEHSTYLAHSGWIRALRLWAYQHVKCVVTQTFDGLQHFRVAGLPVVQIPNSSTDFSDRCQWALGSAANKEGVFTCLSIARFESVKQLSHYVEAARIVHDECPSIRFELVGAGLLEQELREQVARCHLEHVFYFRAPTANVGEYYRKAHVYIISSQSEAFPMTMIEALSFGVPVLSYNKLVGPKEIIKNGYNGYLCEQDQPSALAEKIIGLYRDTSTLARLTKNAFSSSMVFHPERVAYQWLAIL